MRKSLNLQGKKHIWHYFLLVDVLLNDDNLDKNKHPSIISSYSIEGNTKQYLRLKYLITNDDTIRNMVFPPKIENFDIEKTTDFYQFKSLPLFYSNYIQFKHQDPSFHCFLLKDWEKGYYEWYINCLIIWEKCGDNFKAKAMIIVTYEPFFTLSKVILIDIYLKYVNSNKDNVPIEPYIKAVLHNIKAKNGSHLDLVIIDDKLITYSSMSQPYLQHCDLNYRLFFSYFSLNDIVFLAEQFFHLENILICSPHLDTLYPIYHLFISLIQPLGSTDNSYVFRFLSIEATPILFGPISFFLFVYANGIPKTFIEKLVSIKESDITVIYISKNEVTKKVFEFKKKTILEKPFPVPCLIQTVLLNENNEQYYYDLINSKLTLYKNTFKPENKLFFEYSNNDEIRILFFSLFTKFYSCLIPQFTFELKYNEINYIIQNKQEKKTKKQLKVNNFIREVSSASAFQSLYQINIPLDHPNIFYFVLLDELVKIIRMDDKRVYFDFFSGSPPQSETEKIQIINQAEISKMKQRYKELSQTTNTFHFDDMDRLIYDQLCFYFDENNDGKDNVDRIQSDYIPNLFLIDIEVFFYLFEARITLINDLGELIQGLGGLILSVIILNEIENENIPTNALMKQINSLFELFFLTNGFNHKFNFIMTLMFEIIITSNDSYTRFNEKYFKFIQVRKCLPPFLVYLQYNELFSKNKLIKNIMRRPKPRFAIDTIQCLNKVNLNNTKNNDMITEANGILNKILNTIIDSKGLLVEDINYFNNTWENDVKQVCFIYYHLFNKSLFEKFNEGN